MVNVILGLVLLIVIVMVFLSIRVIFNWNDPERLDKNGYIFIIAGIVVGAFITTEGVLINRRINEFKLPRTIDNSENIISVLKHDTIDGPVPRIWIGYQPLHDSEARAFTIQIIDIFKQAGWEINNDAPGHATEGSFKGVRFISYKGPINPSYEEIHKQRRQVVCSAIEMLGESCQIFHNPSTDDEIIGSLVVGPKSPHFSRKSKKCVLVPFESDRFSSNNPK